MPSAGVVVLLAAALVTVSGWFSAPAFAADTGVAWERNGAEVSWSGGGEVTFDVVDGRATATSGQATTSIEVGTATRVRLVAGPGGDELTILPAVAAVGTLTVEVGDGRDLVRLVGAVADGARGGRVEVRGGDDRDLLVVTGGRGDDRVTVGRRWVGGTSLDVDIDGIEDVAVVTEDGDDVVTLAPGDLRSVLVDGGGGTDELAGSAADEARCDDTTRVDGADVTLRAVEGGCDDQPGAPAPTDPASSDPSASAGASAAAGQDGPTDRAGAGTTSDPPAAPPDDEAEVLGVQVAADEPGIGLGVPVAWALGAGLALGGVAFAARPR